MGHMSRKNVVDVTFLLVFSTIFQYQPIRCTDLIEVKNYFSHLLIHFAKCLPSYYADQYFNMTYSTWTECKNRDPAFSSQVSRPHFRNRRGAKNTNVILIQCSDRTEIWYELTRCLKGYGPPQHVSNRSRQIQTDIT